MKIQSAGRIIAGMAMMLAFTQQSQAQQSAQQTVLDGVYSDAQAQRGSRTYRNICSHCHEGGEPDADPLFGQEFIDRWREAPLAYLHGFFSANMPADEPGSLKPAVYLEVLAFLLRENGYPAGSEELSVDTLAAIQLVETEGPQPLPLHALVRASGCLQGEGDSVQLIQSSAFTRVRTADETNPEELALSAAEAPGVAVYQLSNAEKFDVPALAAQKVQVKGVLNSQDAAAASLSVLSLEGTGSSCD